VPAVLLISTFVFIVSFNTARQAVPLSDCARNHFPDSIRHKLFTQRTSQQKRTAVYSACVTLLTVLIKISLAVN